MATGNAKWVGGGVSLQDFFDNEVLPRLSAELVFTHPAHGFQKDPDKWKGGCPRHQSRSGTAFYLDPHTLIWRCPACDAGGGPLQYDYWVAGKGASPRGQDYVDAVADLAQRVGLELPKREPNPEREAREQAWEARRSMLVTVMLVTQAALWDEESDGALEARTFLHGRGFTDEAIRELGFGLFRRSSDVKDALTAAGHSLEEANDAGLTWNRNAGFIIIPWLDERGRPLSLYGRYFRQTPPLMSEHYGWKWKRNQLRERWEQADAATRGEWLEPPVPKTISLPGELTKASPLYLDRARHAGHKQLILVEGVFDAAILQARGDRRVVACVAAQLSKEQTLTLQRCKIEQVAICLDPDSAGDSGTLSCIKALDSVDITSYVVPRLPDGKDPDEFVLAHGMEAWDAHVGESIHSYRYQARLLLDRHRSGDRWTDAGRAAVMQAAVAFMEKVTNPARRLELDRFFLDEIHEGAGIKRDAVTSQARANTPTNANLQELLDEAVAAPPDDQQAKLEELVAAVASSAILADQWGERVKGAKLCTKTAFLDQVDQHNRQRRRQARAHAQSEEHAGLAADQSGPLIDADDGDLARVAGLAWQAIHEANDPPFLFRHGGIAVRLETDDHGLPVIRTVTQDRLCHVLAREIRWFREHPESGEQLPAHPPDRTIRDILATPNMPLPKLARIVEAPVFALSGALQTEPGYHAAGCTYYAPAKGFIVPEVAHQPTPADVARARDLLVVELLGDFPFTTDAERAHAVAIILLPFVRAFIAGPTPLHLIEKPSPGTGASLLADILTYPALGHPLSMMTEGRDEDEWRKRITSKLRTGCGVLMIDNLRRRLDSAAFAAAITSTFWEDRLLGSSEMIRIPVACVWIATGNNPGLSSEITRRTVRIRLDAKRDQPWLRDGFRHEDLRGWAAEHRGDLVWAALTLGRAWLAAGRPQQQKPRLGMFEAWSGIMGGILAVAGIPGFLTNLEEFYEDTDTEGAMWRNFVQTWWMSHGESEVGTAELFSLAVHVDPPLELGDGSEKSQRTRLGKALKFMRDRHFNYTTEEGGVFTLRVTTTRTHNRAQLYRLVQRAQGEMNVMNVNEPFRPSPHVSGVLSGMFDSTPDSDATEDAAENVHTGSLGSFAIDPEPLSDDLGDWNELFPGTDDDGPKHWQ